MASACLRPPQKGPPHSGSAARGGTRQQKEGEKEIIERNKKLRHFQQMTQRKEEAKTMGANSRNTKGKMRKQQDRKPKIWERGRDEKNYKRSKGRQWKRFKSTGVKRQFLVSIDQEGWRKDAEANGKVFKVFILKKIKFLIFTGSYMWDLWKLLFQKVNFLPKCSFELVKYKADIRGVGIIQNHWIVDYLTVPVT